MYILAENVPPELNQIGGVRVVGGSAGGLALRVEGDQPGFHFASKMQNLDFISESERQNK